MMTQNMVLIPAQDMQIRSWNEPGIVHPESFSEAIDIASKNQLTPEARERIMNEVLDPTSGIDLVSLLQQVRDFEHPLGLSQKAAVRTCFESCQDDIQNLKTQISGAISTISRIGRELSEASCRLVKRSKDLCAIQILFTENQHLPQDILEQIFLQTIHPNDQLKLRSRCPSLQLGAVCHRWRAIIHSMSAMWDIVHIHPSSPSSIELAKLWLNRSRRPSVILYPCGNLVRVVTSSAFAFLHEASKRFRKLCFLEGWDYTTVRPLFVNAQSEKLEELVFRSQRQLPEIRVPHLGRLFFAGGSNLCPGLTSSSVHLKQLTVLGITSPVHPYLLLFILSQFPGLHQLCILLDACRPREGNRITHPIIHLNLRYLGIADMSRGSGVIQNNLLDNITFPNLDTMEYRSVRGDGVPPHWLCTHPLLHRLQRFTFADLMEVESEAILTNLLPQMPSLQHLCFIADRNGIGSALQVLASIPSQSGEGPPLVPLLRHLTIGSDAAFKGLDKFTPEFQQLIRAWSHPDTVSNPQDPLPTHTLTRLQIHYWGRSGIDFSCDHKKPQLFDRLLGISPRLTIQFTGESTALASDPAFQFYPKPFSDQQRYYVMGNDGSWKLGSLL
ncbi:hypothetical protein BDN72DRAFT_962294 [Pluteus cervinus]|uniref:Uncharacterized protein n=1 Tax=Pluteus cervinus TaxID=181527 RepID=A0ACD3AJ50_9AGAR|nr:hypothetical protein BDN72DRAFT_962294 [Pluteus cervinus]